MDNQHRKITGYRELDQDEIGRMNQGKELEYECMKLLDFHLGAGADPRWIAIARTHIQQGFMAQGRAVARPTGYPEPTPEG